MTIIGTLAVSLKANTTKYRKGMKRAETITQKFGRVVKGLSKGLAVGLSASFVAAGAAAGFMVKQQFAVIDATAKSSDRIGIATEKLIGFQFAASIMGVEAANLEKAFIKMQASISEAGQGLSTPLRALDQLRLSSKDLISLSPDKQLLKISTALSKVQNQSDKTRIAKDLFGRGGTQLLNLLNLGAEGINELTSEAEELGIVFDRFDAAKIERANDSVKRLKEALRGAAQVLAVQMAPFVSVIADGFREMGREAGAFGPLLIDTFESIAIGAARLTDMVKPLKDFADVMSKLNVNKIIIDQILAGNVFDAGAAERAAIKFFADLKAKTERAREEANKIRRDTDDLFRGAGQEGVLGAAFRQSLAAREIRSLRNVNPNRNLFDDVRANRMVQEESLNVSKGILTQAEKQTRSLNNMRNLLDRAILTDPATFDDAFPGGF